MMKIVANRLGVVDSEGLEPWPASGWYRSIACSRTRSHRLALHADQMQVQSRLHELLEHTHLPLALVGVCSEEAREAMWPVLR